jgi:hypothetical protein
MRGLVERVHVEDLRAGRQGEPLVAHAGDTLKKHGKVKKIPT